MADDDLDFDLDDFPDEGGEGRRRSPAGSGSGGDGRRSRWWIWLLLGVALGVAAALLVPRWVAPHLPPALGGGLVTVEGDVLDKQRESGRLLLTLDSDRGAMLATFRDRISELDLLVGRGDRVTLAMREFRPFVDGPRLVGVQKGDWEGRVPRSGADAGEAADTAGARADGAAPDTAADAAGPGGDGASAPDTAPDDDGGPTPADTSAGPGAGPADG